jgi:hypothetical protein
MHVTLKSWQQQFTNRSKLIARTETILAKRIWGERV